MLLTICLSSKADTFMWGSITEGQNWRYPFNWGNPFIFPDGSSDVAKFGTSGDTTVLMNGSLTLSRLEFLTGAKAFTISGGSDPDSLLTLHNGIIVEVGVNNPLSISSGIHLEENQTWDVRSSSLSISSVIDDYQTWNPIVLTKEGAGTLRLSGANTFGGGLILNAGKLEIANNDALGDGTFTVNGGSIAASGGTRSVANSLNLNANVTFGGDNLTFSGYTIIDANRILTVDNTTTFAGAIAESGGARSLTKEGNGTLVLGGSSYSGGTIVNAGLMRNGMTDALQQSSSLTVGNLGTFDLGAFDQRLSGVTNTGTLTSSRSSGTSVLTIDNSTDNTLGGTVSGHLAIVKNGTSTLTLLGNQSFDGGVTLYGGTLQVGHNNALGTGQVSLNGGTILATGGSRTLANQLNVGGNVTFGGTLGLTFSSPWTLTQDRTLTVNNTTAFLGAIGESGGVRTLTKQGTGTLILGANNSYSGSTIVNAGTLRNAATDAVLPASELFLGGSGTFDLGTFNQTLSGITSSGTITSSRASGTSVLTIDNGLSQTLGGTVSGPLAIKKTGSGSLTINGAKSFTGGVTLNDGSLGVTDNAALGTGPISLNGGTLQANGGSRTFANALSFGGDATFAGEDLIFSSAFTLDANRTFTVNNTTTFGGVISEIGGARSLTKEGTGTLILGANNTYSGGTIVNAGTLRNGVTDALLPSAPLTVGSSGTYDLGAFSQTFSGIATSEGTITSLRIDSGTSVLTFNGPTDNTLGGSVRGHVAVVKTGSGNLTLAGDNNFAGGVTLSNGTLGIGHNNALGDGTLLLNAGTIQASGGSRNVNNLVTLGGDITFGGTDALTFSGIGTLTAPRVLTVNNTTTFGGGLTCSTFTNAGSGTMILGQQSSYAGGATVNAGTLKNGASDALQSQSLTVGNSGAYDLGSFDQYLFTINNSGSITSSRSGGTSVLTINSAPSGLGGTISGPVRIIKAGNDILTISGNNSFSGGFTFSQGGLRLGNDNALGTGTISMDSGGTIEATGGSRTLVNALSLSGDATLTLSGTDALAFNGGGSLAGARSLAVNNNSMTWAGNIAGTGSLTKSGAGTLALSGNSSFSGGVNLYSGTLTVGNNNALGTGLVSFQDTAVIQASGGNWILPNAVSFGADVIFGGTEELAFTGAGTLTGHRALTINNNATTLSGALGGAFSLTKWGAGALVLSGNSTFSGGVALNSGTLRVGHNSGLGTGTLTINTGTTVEGANGARTVANPIYFGGSAAFAGDDLTFSGAGTLPGHRTFTVNNATTFSGVIGSGIWSITKAGAGSLVLSNNNTFSGGVTLNQGTLGLGHDNGFGTGPLTLNAGTIQAAGATRFMFNPVTIAGDVTFGGGNELVIWGASTLNGNRTLTVNNLTVFNTAISQAGTSSLTKEGTGTLRLSAHSGHTGGTIINAGTLQTFGNNTLETGSTVTIGSLGTWDLEAGSQTLTGITNSGTITSSGTSFAWPLTINNSTPQTLGGTMSGLLALVKSGTGTLTIQEAKTFTGGVTLSSGTLLIGHDQALGTGTFSLNGGTLQSSGGSHTLANALSFGGNPTLSGADDLTFTGTGTLTGNRTLTVNNITTLSGNIGQDVSGRTFTKAGTGTLTLAGNNTFSGGLTLSAGTLRIGDTGGLGAGTFSLNGGVVETFGGPQTVPNTVSVGGNTTFGGSDTLTFSGAATLTQNRTLTVNNTTAFSGSLNGFTLTKEGAGTLVLGTATTHSGTTVNAGTLRNGVNGAVSDSFLLTIGAGGTYDLSAFDQTLRQLSNSGTVTSSRSSGTSTLTLNVGNALTLGGTVTGPVAISKIGASSLTLPSAQNFTGGVTLNTGTLLVGNDGALGSGTLALNGGTFQSSGGSRSLANPLSPGANTTLAGADALNFTGGGTLSGSGSLTVNNTTTLSGGIGGAGSLAVSGSGTLILSSDNSFSGGFTQNGATLRVGSDGALGTGTLALNNGTIQAASGTRTINNPLSFSANMIFGGSDDLIFNGSFTLPGSLTLFVNNKTTFAGDISGTSTLNKWGSGTLILSSAHNSYSGGTSIQNGGTLKNGITDALPTSTALTIGSGTTYDLAAFDQTIEGINNSGTIKSSRTEGTSVLTIANPISANLGGTISGPVLIAKSGAGFLNVSDGLVFTGAVAVNAGTLIVAGTHNFSGVTLNGGAVQVESNTALGTTPLSLNGGTIKANGGSRTLASPLTLLGNATFQSAFGSSDALIFTALATLSGGSTLTVNNTTTFSGGINGSQAVSKAGTGTLVLPGNNNDFSGGLTLSGGTLKIGSDGALGTGALSLNGGTIQSSSGARTVANAVSLGGDSGFGGTDALTFSGPGTATGSSTLSVGNTTTFAGIIGGTGALTKSGAGTLILPANNTFSGGMTLTGGTLLFGSDGALGSGTLALNGGTIQSSIGARTVANALGLGGAVIFGGTDALTFTGPGTLTANSSLATSSTATFSGEIAGAFSLTNVGSGTLILSGNNNFSGALIHTNGTLALGHDNAAGAGTLSLIGGTIQAIGGTRSLATPVSFGGNITFGGTDNLTFTGAGTLAAFPIFTVLNNTTLSGNIGQSGGTRQFTKAGAGTLTLSGDNTFGGGIIMNAGTLRLGHDGAVGKGIAASLQMNGGAIQAAGGSRTITNGLFLGGNMTFSGTDDLIFASQFNLGLTANRTLTVNNNTTFSCNIVQSGTRTLTKAGTGTLTLSGNNSFSGMTLSAGTLRVGRDTALGSGTTSLNGGIIEATGASRTLANVLSLGGNVTFGGGDNLTFNGGATLTGNRTLTANNTTTFAGIIGQNVSGRTLTIAGTGTLVLSGNNSFSGGATLNSGTVRLGHDNALGTGAATLNGGIIEASGSSRTIANSVSYGGNLTFGGTDSLLFTGAGTLSGDRTLTVNNTTELSGDLGETGGARSLTKAGTGTLVLSGNNTYTGSTHVDAGILKVDGYLLSSPLTIDSGARLTGSGAVGSLTLQSGGTLSPGNSPGTLTLGNTAWRGAGNYDWQVYDATNFPGIGYDLLQLNGTLALTDADDFNINLWTLAGTNPDQNGQALNFDPTHDYSWTLVKTTDGIIDFDAAKFNIVTAAANGTGGFANPTFGSFSLGVSANDLVLSYEPDVPIVTSPAAGNLTRLSADLSGTVDPNGLTTSAWFEYGLTPGYGAATSPVSLGGSDGVQTVAADLIGLSHSSTYYYRLVASSSAGITYSAEQTFATPPNHSPVAANDAVERSENKTVKVLAAKLVANDYDPDGDVLSVTGVSSPTANGATVTIDAGWVIYMPPVGFNDTDTFTYTVSDGYGGTASGVVSVMVRPPDTAQTQNILSITPLAGGTMRIRFVGIPGRTYAVEASETLGAPIWAPLGTVVAGNNGVFEYDDTDAPNHTTRFYRAVRP